MKIDKGPFADTEIPEGEITHIQTSDGLLPFWPTEARTPVFLEKYSPEMGWQILVETASGGFDLPDTRNLDQHQQSVLVQPTQMFVVKLVKDDKVYSQGSTLAIIDGPSAWERGESVARGRMYAASGLPGFLKLFPNTTDSSKGARNIPTVEATSTTIPLVITPIATESSSRGARDEEEPGSAVDLGQSNITGDTASRTDSQVSDLTASAEPTQTPAAAATVLKHPAAKADRLGKKNIGKEVDENLREQIIVLSESMNVPIPVIETSAEARDFYKKLLRGTAPSEQAS